MYDIQHCFICHPSDFTMSEDAGIEPRTVATTALAVRRPNHSARSHPHGQHCLYLVIISDQWGGGGGWTGEGWVGEQVGLPLLLHFRLCGWVHAYKILSPWLGHIVDPSIEFSHRPVSLCSSLAGWCGNPMPCSRLYPPCQRLKIWPLEGNCLWGE